MAETPLDAQKRKEAQRQYDQLTARIAALDTDIGRSTDSEHTLTAQQARADLARQRDAVATELAALGWGNESNHAEIRGKITDLLTALDSKQPEKAHKILGDIVAIEARMSAAEGTLEEHSTRLDTIERKQNPPIIVTALRIIALAVFLFAGTLFWIKDTREVLFGLFPWAGIATEGALMLAVVAILLLANAQLEKAR